MSHTFGVQKSKSPPLLSFSTLHLSLSLLEERVKNEWVEFRGGVGVGKAPAWIKACGCQAGWLPAPPRLTVPGAGKHKWLRPRALLLTPSRADALCPRLPSGESQMFGQWTESPAAFAWGPPIAFVHRCWPLSWGFLSVVQFVLSLPS